MGPDGPKWGQEDFVLLIQTLPTFWAERILILIIFIIFVFFGFQISWISRSPDFQNLVRARLGLGWARLEPSGPTILDFLV